MVGPLEVSITGGSMELLKDKTFWLVAIPILIAIISEIMPFIKSVKANSVLQIVTNIGKLVFSILKRKK